MSSADLAALITGPPAVYVPSLVSLPMAGGRCDRRAGEGRVLCSDAQDDALERLAWEITVQDANAEGSQRGEIIVLTLGAGEWGASGDGFLADYARNSWSAVFWFSCLKIRVTCVLLTWGLLAWAGDVGELGPRLLQKLSRASS